jgi:small-conductance mechanosensitive channel
MDRSFEVFFDFFFYLFVLFVFLAVMGVDPMYLFATVASVIFSFSFIIGTSCQNFLNGFLMVFIRRPYDIGDRIACCQPYTDSPTTGSSGWVVKDIDLFTTTVVYGSSSEVATYQNVSLYMLRIINQTRSPLAYVSFNLKFGVDTPFEKLQVFKAALEKFVKARPREVSR